MLIYTGIGSRSTPDDVLKQMEIIGEELAKAKWCRLNGIGYHVVKQRRKRGMSIKDAITTPLNTSKQGRKKYD